MLNRIIGKITDPAFFLSAFAVTLITIWAVNNNTFGIGRLVGRA